MESVPQNFGKTNITLKNTKQKGCPFVRLAIIEYPVKSQTKIAHDGSFIHIQIISSASLRYAKSAHSYPSVAVDCGYISVRSEDIKVVVCASHFCIFIYFILKSGANFKSIQ